MYKKLLLVVFLLPWNAGVAKQESYTAQRALREGNYAEAYCLLKPLAQKGDADAQYQLGWMYHNGYGLAVDDAKALYWWEKSAKQSAIDAEMALVMLYREGGVGVKKNLPKAAKYLLRAAIKGDEEARLLLSYFLDDPDWALEKQLQALLKEKPDSLGPSVYVKVEKANLRAAPDASAKLIATIPQGGELVLLARRKGWAHVIARKQSKLAWVRGDLIDGVRPLATTPKP